MYTLVKDHLLYALRAELPSLTISLVIAEVFYKFGSFTLEAAAFLATWWAVGAVGRIAGRATSPLHARWRGVG